MTKDDFVKIGLKYTNCVGYSAIVVKDWEKFFPQINLPIEGPLLDIAKECWHALVTYSECDGTGFDIRVRGANVFYYKNNYTLDTFVTTKEYFLKIYCPYNANDVRRYVWFNMLSQFDYIKICNDIQETLTNIIRVKND